MKAAVASGGTTGSFKLSMDGKDITEEIAVPAATEGENNFDEYNEVEAKVELTEGEHILRFTVIGDWMDIDWIEFCAGESCGEILGIHEAVPSRARSASAIRLHKQGGQLIIEKNGHRFDVTGHRLK